MERLSVLYFIEPMMGLGSHYWAQTIAKAIVEAYSDIELTVLVDDLVPFEVDHDRVHWVKLPICRNQVTDDGSLAFELIDERGKVVDEVWKRKRADLVFSSFHRSKPNVVLLHNHLSGLEWDKLIEFEYQALVEVARSMPWSPPIVATAMDVIDGFEDGCAVRAEEYLQKVKAEVDYILVCGDSLELFIYSCPPATQFRDKLVLTGYPIDSSPILPLADASPSAEILVAAGGSELGYRLFQTAIAAFEIAHHRNITPLINHPWRLLVGPNLKDQMPALQEMAATVAATVGAENQLIVQPAVSSSEYLSRLTHHCVVSISQCGQGTFVDLEQSGVPAVVVPYEANGMVQEQVYRSQFLQDAGRGVFLKEQHLTPDSLLAGLRQAISIGRKQLGVNLDGSKAVANFIHELALRNQISYLQTDSTSTSPVPFRKSLRDLRKSIAVEEFADVGQENYDVVP
jgi:predicted glycosyltransferase